ETADCFIAARRAQLFSQPGIAVLFLEKTGQSLQPGFAGGILPAPRKPFRDRQIEIAFGLDALAPLEPALQRRGIVIDLVQGLPTKLFFCSIWPRRRRASSAQAPFGSSVR